VKVLMTADTVGGVWTYACELAAELERRELEVVIAAMGREPREPLMAGLDVRFAPFALEWMEDPWDDVERAGDWLLELRDEVEPAIVHVNGYAHAALDWSAPVVSVAHSDVLSWFEAVRGTPAPRSWARYAAVVEAGLDAADVVVSPTCAQLESLERHYRFASQRTVIPNGRRPLSARLKEPLVAAAGRAWDEAKGLDRLARLSLPWPLEVADGTHPAAETEALLARAAIFVEPARYEPFGLAALEAAGTGAALVLGDIASLREVWGDSALFVANERELDEAVRALIAADGLRREYGERARRRARELSPDRMADAYLALYTGLRSKVAA
jgi:glycosyltransferase involved in cell wall biosynthesis